MDQPDTAERLHRLPAYTCYSNYCAVLFMRVLVFCRVSLRKDASPLTRTVRSNCSFLFSFSLSACFSYCFAAPLTDRRSRHLYEASSRSREAPAGGNALGSAESHRERARR